MTPVPGADRSLLAFKPHLRAEVVPGEATYLISSSCGVTVVEGAYVEALVPLLDGTRTLERLIEDAAPTVPPAETGRLVGRLARANLVGYRSRTADDAAHAYWELAGVGGAETEQALAGLPVHVVATGRVSEQDAVAACRDNGLLVVDPDDQDASVFTLVLCDDYLDPALGLLDKRHRADGRPWLLAKPYGAQPWVGPVFRPDSGPCWSCLAHRLRGQRRSEIPAQRALGLTGPIPRPEASLPAGRTMGLQAAVLGAAKWLAGVRNSGDDAVCTLDTVTMTTRHHPVQRRPQCGDCGEPGLVAAGVLAPVRPMSRAKSSSAGDGQRAMGPDQVLRSYGHLVSPVTGIVDEVSRETRLPESVNCFVSGRNLAMEAQSLAGLRSGLRGRSSGKGTTALEAEVGALCEAAERYCGTLQGDEPTVRETMRGLGAAALHPNSCQLFDRRQFGDRERWNASNSAFHQVPAPFDRDRPVHWTPVWSLTSNSQRFLPTSMLYFGTSADASAHDPWADSNGNAAGSSLEDAILQGFLELVERDAVAQWWYNRTRHPAVDLDSFDQPWLAGLRRAYTEMNRQLWVLDLTSDFGIPVMAAISRRTDKPAQDLAFGFGAHFDPGLALRRALTEMGQLLPAVIGAQPDGSGYGVLEPELMSWWTTATAENQPYLLPDPAESARTPGSFDYRPRADLRDDIRAAEELVRSHGMEMLVLDQTRPDVKLPVVKVIVPGLRHFWARLGPGRLFDVPVQRGLLARKVTYENLNPIRLFV